MSAFNEYYPKTSDIIKQLMGEINIADESQFLSDGDFYLPWEYVTFMDGYMFVYHPSYPNGKSGHLPLKHYNDVSNKALNNIKGYIMKKLQPIRVAAKNSKIVAIQNINQISEAIEFLHMTSTNECVKLLKKENSIAKSVSIHNQESSEVL